MVVKNVYVFRNICFEIYLMPYVHKVLDKAIKETLSLHFEKITIVEYNMDDKIKELTRDFNRHKSKLNIVELERSMGEQGFDVWQDTSGNVRVANVETIGFQIQCSKPRVKYKRKDYKKYAFILHNIFTKFYAKTCKAGYLKISSEVLWSSIKQTRATNQEIEFEVKEDKGTLVYGLKDEKGEYVRLRVHKYYIQTV